MIKALSDFPVIETERLRVSPLRRRDARALLSITDASITKSIDFLNTPFSLDDACALIAGNDLGRNCFLGVWNRGDERLIGTIGTHLRGKREIEIGYWFAAYARGQGFASEALHSVIQSLGTSYPDRRILAECRAENIPSWRLLERTGFRATGEEGHRPGRLILSWNGRAN